MTKEQLKAELAKMELLEKVNNFNQELQSTKDYLNQHNIPLDTQIVCVFEGDNWYAIIEGKIYLNEGNTKRNHCYGNTLFVTGNCIRISKPWDIEISIHSSGNDGTSDRCFQFLCNNLTMSNKSLKDTADIYISKFVNSQLNNLS